MSLELSLSAPLRAKNMTSMECGKSVLRKLSRTKRLTKLRPTAVGIFFLPITSPKRDEQSSLNFASNSHFGWEILQVFRSKTSLNSEALSKRWSLPNLKLGTQPIPYAERRLRPFARRRFNTALPPAVAIRALKPWVRFRFRLLG